MGQVISLNDWRQRQREKQEVVDHVKELQSIVERMNHFYHTLTCFANQRPGHGSEHELMMMFPENTLSHLPAVSFENGIYLYQSIIEDSWKYPHFNAATQLKLKELELEHRHRFSSDQMASFRFLRDILALLIDRHQMRVFFLDHTLDDPLDTDQIEVVLYHPDTLLKNHCVKITLWRPFNRNMW